jgi:hypothetical protein
MQAGGGGGGGAHRDTRDGTSGSVNPGLHNCPVGGTTRAYPHLHRLAGEVTQIGKHGLAAREALQCARDEQRTKCHCMPG